MNRTIVLTGLCLAVLTVAGCASTPEAGSPPSSSPSRASNPGASDRGIRPVRPATGMALSYLQPESGSQVLCAALPVARWEELLGGKVGRRPVVTPPDTACFLGSDTANVAVSLSGPAPGSTPSGRVAGRPASPVSDNGVTAEASVALTDDYKSTRSYPPMKPTLVVSVTGFQGSLDKAARQRMVTGILDALTPVLAAEGEQVPAADQDGGIAFVRTAVTAPTLIDLPRPIQALQLCTALLDLGYPNQKASDRGECRAQSRGPNVSLKYTRADVGEYTAKIAGRSAKVSDGWVEVRLRDDVPVDLVVDNDDAKALAAKLVPVLT